MVSLLMNLIFLHMFWSKLKDELILYSIRIILISLLNKMKVTMI